MIRPVSLAVAGAMTALMSGCVAMPAPVNRPPALAAYFDCVRERGVAISAHRGQSADDQPENSIAAIEATGGAIPGAIVELDAVLTRNGGLVLMHDETMERTTTGRGRVADLTTAEVQAARLRAPDGALTGAAPPTLAQALDAAGRVGAIASLDLKADNEAATVVLAQAVIDQVRRSRAADRVILITYTPETARAVAALAPEMMISAGAKSLAALDGLNRPQILAWTGAGEPNPQAWAALKAAGVEAQFGTLGAEGRRLDDRFAADGNASEYRDLYDQGVTVFATDTPLAVQGVLAVEVAAAATCRR